MSKTRHMQSRMSERAIKTDLVDLAERFGSPEGDKIVLNQKAIDCLLKELKVIQRVAHEAQKKGGLVVVQDGGLQITTYRLNSYRRAAS